MIKSVSNVSFGTGINPISAKIEEAKRKDSLTKENMECLNELMDDGSNSCLVLPVYGGSSSCLHVYSSIYNAAKKVVNVGEQYRSINDKKYLDSYKKLKAELNQKDEITSLMKDYVNFDKDGATKEFNLEKFLGFFTKEKGLSDKIVKKENNIIEILKLHAKNINNLERPVVGFLNGQYVIEKEGEKIPSESKRELLESLKDFERTYLDKQY